MDAFFGPAFADLFTRLAVELGLMEAGAAAPAVVGKSCVIQQIDEKKAAPSKKSYTELLAVIPDPVKPDELAATTQKTYAALFSKQNPYNYAVDYQIKDDMNILLELPKLSDPTEKLWLKKFTNDMKIKYLAAQTYMLKHYHLRAVKALPDAADRMAYMARVENFNTQPHHIRILRTTMTELFTNLDKEIYNTKKYMDRLNGAL